MVWTRNAAGTKRLAPCLVALFAQADARWPARSRASDGSLGDPAHAARVSDHNPDASGDVLAGDLTDDKVRGCDADAFAEHLRVTRDRRVKYVICNGRVFRSYGASAWRWTPYTGVNAHEKHTHVSVLDTDEAKTDLRPWFPPQEGNSATEPGDETIMADAKDLLALLAAKEAMQSILGRTGEVTGDDPGLIYWTGRFANENLAVVLKAMADSAEGKAR